LAIGVVFIASSIPKLMQPYDFLAGVYSYELVGPKLGVMVAIMLPWLELFVGICLVGGVFVRGAILASMGMCAMFSLVLASAFWRGLGISCGCFSLADQNMISYWTVIRAVALLTVSAAIYIYAVFGEQKISRN
ncbi:MAG TPA: MauE/DoxX family redox-associated membrane protein, partial [Sedimentisphaerales bacterium]